MGGQSTRPRVEVRKPDVRARAVFKKLASVATFPSLIRSGSGEVLGMRGNPPQSPLGKGGSKAASPFWIRQ